MVLLLFLIISRVGWIVTYVPSIDGYPNALGASWPDRIEIVESRQNDEIILIHEYLHHIDWLDDNILNGSPEPVYCNEVPTDCSHSWVFWALRNRDLAIPITQRILDESNLSGYKSVTR